MGEEEKGEEIEDHDGTEEIIKILIKFLRSQSPHQLSHTLTDY